MPYDPSPSDTNDIELDPELNDLLEMLAENVHEEWARKRMDEGWRYGAQRDDARKLHPCLVPYGELPESEKEYDRNTAAITLKLIQKLGYAIRKKG
jgi:ryanodine receptor 2